MIWGNISRSVNGENVLGGVAYKNKYIYTLLHFHSGVGGLGGGGEDFSPMNMSLRTLWPGFSPVNQLAELE